MHLIQNHFKDINNSNPINFDKELIGGKKEKWKKLLQNVSQNNIEK